MEPMHTTIESTKPQTQLLNLSLRELLKIEGLRISTQMRRLLIGWRWVKTEMLHGQTSSLKDVFRKMELTALSTIMASGSFCKLLKNFANTTWI